MSDRIRFISHKGRRVLIADLSNSSGEELARLCYLVPSILTDEPKGSVLLLADFSGAKFDKKNFTGLKEAAVFDRPHVKRSAWVGVESLPKVFFQNVKSFSQRDLPTFKMREEALDRLVTEELEQRNAS